MFLRLLLTFSIAAPPTEEAAQAAYSAGDLEVALRMYLELAEAPGAHRPTALDGAHTTLRALHRKEPKAGHLCRAHDMARELVQRDDFANAQERGAWIEMEAEDAHDLADVTCPAASSKPTPPPQPEPLAKTPESSAPAPGPKVSLHPAESGARPERSALAPGPKASPYPWRPRGQIAAASALGVVGVGLLGWMGGALVGRARANDEIVRSTAAAAAVDREVTPAERDAVHEANDRYRRLDMTAKWVGLAGGVIFLTSFAVLFIPPRNSSHARLRASGAGIVYSF